MDVCSTVIDTSHAGWLIISRYALNNGLDLDEAASLLLTTSSVSPPKAQLTGPSVISIDTRPQKIKGV